MVYVSLVLVVLAVATLAAWSAREPAPTPRSLPCSTDRLGRG